MNRRVRPRDLGLVGGSARAPAGAPTQRADPLGLLGGHLRRRAPRAAGALSQARQRRPGRAGTRGASGAPTPRPSTSRRSPKRPPGRTSRLAQRHDARLPTAQAACDGLYGAALPGLLEGRELNTHTLLAGPDLPTPRSKRPWARQLVLRVVL